MKLAAKIFKRNDYYITSPYGYRTNPITGEKGTFHDAVDYGTHTEKWPQYAIAKGKVLSCGADTKYANAKFVWVEYPQLGFKLLHYHLDQIKVVKGQEVDENTVLGTTGMTGLATGIHLHLGMKYLSNNKYVDAELYDFKGDEEMDLKTVERDETKHQVEITITNLNARDGANANKLGFYMPKGLYNVLEEKTENNVRWVKVTDKVWCALLEDCFIEYKPTSTGTCEEDHKLDEQLEKLKKCIEETMEAIKCKA